MIKVVDNFCKNPQAVRDSALASHFGTWKPGQGASGASHYDGMNFWGDHASLLKPLATVFGSPILPSKMFFRITNPSMDNAFIHSDCDTGDWTALVYLSPTREGSGTGFYRYRATGEKDMKPVSQMVAEDPEGFKTFHKEMIEASDEVWDQYQFVEARYNRCVIFDAPKFHCRIPKNGYGHDEQDSRMVWACHFYGD